MNKNALERPLTRRQVLTAGFTAGAGFLVGCGSAGRDAAGWTFVDDRKQTARLSKRPTRIVAFTTAAIALHQWGVTPVGVFGDNPREDPELAGFPWGKSEIVGSVYGEIDIAKLLSLEAELIVSRWYPPPADSPLFGFKELEQEQRIGSRVPIVGINSHVIATKQIDRFSDLARELGSDTMAGAVGRARAAFLRAVANLSGVAKRKPNLRIIAVSGDQSTMFVSKLADSGDLTFYRRRGLPLVSAETSDAYWDRFSWDQAAKYPADGILYDARPSTLPLREAKAIPAFAALPSVRANQVARWRADPPPSYQAYTAAMNDLATTIAGWRTVT
ncbi:MAG: iron-desferrioxamine transport system substrate-binding protein [Solirubrobacteraceae bacterium]|jgi:iron complex transport system substrate-binding protein|nr:iron-desferrioxamine transport system substrate-binding protein [Solirubrobacteraceae bacterium]